MLNVELKLQKIIQPNIFYIIEHILNDGDMTDSVQIKTDYAFLAMNKVDNWLEIILSARKQIIEKLINHNIAKIEHQMPIAQARELKIAHPNFEYDPIVFALLNFQLQQLIYVVGHMLIT